MREYEVRDWCGSPAVFIDGKPVSGLMHWTRCPSVEDTALFRDAGVHFYSFMGNLEVPAPAGTPEEDLEIRDGGLPRMLLTHENIDKTMSMLTQCNPEIRILPRIIMNPPAWWEKLHPEELTIYYNYEKRSQYRGPRASLGSELWNSTWKKYLAETVRYFEEKWGSFIIGYHPGLGHCGEHDYQWWDTAADFSEKHRRIFTAWLKKKYGTISGLNRVWKSEWKDFSSIPLPDPKRYDERGPRTPAIYLPESETDLVDFLKFNSDRMAEIILEEAHTVKTTLAELGRKKLFGVFYGYINLVANSSQTAVGHSALTKLLESPDVDFICGPLSYGGRQNGGCVLSQMIPGSIHLHGKVFYNEDDTGTHVVQRPHHGYIPDTAEQSVHVEKRNFLETLRTGGTQWWMDLYGCGWFLDEKLKNEFAFLKNFGEKYFHDRRSSAECAVFVSLESSLYMRDNPVPLTGNLIEQQLFEIAAMGTSFDIYQDTDIPLLAKQGKLDQYKFCIFANSLVVSPEIREAVKTHLENRNRTILWFYAPGYIKENERSEKFAEELTGIHFTKVEKDIMPMLTETWVGQEKLRITYGLTRAVYPRFCAKDPEAETLGFYVNSTTITGRENGEGVSLARKKMPDFTSIWSSSPELPSCLLTQFAEEAGCHIYSKRGDQILFGPGWFGIHSKVSGPLEIKFPGKHSFRNAVTGEILPDGEKIVIPDAKRGETYLFELGDAQ